MKSVTGEKWEFKQHRISTVIGYISFSYTFDELKIKIKDEDGVCKMPIRETLKILEYRVVDIKT